MICAAWRPLCGELARRTQPHQRPDPARRHAHAQRSEGRNRSRHAGGFAAGHPGASGDACACPSRSNQRRRKPSYARGDGQPRSAAAPNPADATRDCARPILPRSHASERGVGATPGLGRRWVSAGGGSARNRAPDLDIFVGGNNASGFAKNPARNFHTKYGRTCAISVGKIRTAFLNAIRSAPPGTRVNVVGTSCGVHTAGFGIGMMAPTGIRVDKFISIDRVGRQPIPEPFRGAVGNWVNVNSTPAETARSHRSAALGRRGDRFPVDEADLNYNVDVSHAEL